MFIAIAALIFTSCGLYNSTSINDLQLGTTKQQVDDQFGYPLRMLSMGNVGGAYSEVYEYKIRNSVYALEYVSNRLNFVELLYEYDEYYPSNPSPSYPPSGRPSGRPEKPHNPGNGGGNVRPPANSGGINRPPTNRTDGNNSTGRPPMDQKPSEPTRPTTPARPSEPVRPATPTKPAEPAKPVEPTKPETNTNRPSTGRQTGGSRNSTTRSEETNNTSTDSSTNRNTSSGRASSGGSR